MLKKIIISFYISCLPVLGVCQFSEDFCKYLTNNPDSTISTNGLQTELEFKLYSSQFNRQSTFYTATSGTTSAFYTKRYVRHLQLPDFVPFDYVWLPLIDDITCKFKKGIIGGLLEINNVQPAKLDPQFAFPFTFSFQLQYNDLSLIKMDLTEDNSFR